MSTTSQYISCLVQWVFFFFCVNGSFLSDWRWIKADKADKLCHRPPTSFEGLVETRNASKGTFYKYDNAFERLCCRRNLGGFPFFPAWCRGLESWLYEEKMKTNVSTWGEVGGFLPFEERGLDIRGVHSVPCLIFLGGEEISPARLRILECFLDQAVPR